MDTGQDQASNKNDILVYMKLKISGQAGKGGYHCNWFTSETRLEMLARQVRTDRKKQQVCFSQS
jgi:hypothetical protein